MTEKEVARVGRLSLKPPNYFSNRGLHFDMLPDIITWQHKKKEVAKMKWNKIETKQKGIQLYLSEDWPSAGPREPRSC